MFRFIPAILKIRTRSRDRPQAPQYDLRLLGANESISRPRNPSNRHVAVGLQHLARKANALYRAERRERLASLAAIADDHLFEEGGGAPHQVLVAQK